ncbi:DUF421 domain-containing protein [Cellulophaga sp. HaHaR_3_176]|uniref:DUF421 domain-containing protein n=1 Tax=Cellulophaga sp. HaHaR_3_176 TaxID=1942464 RepID=UPI001C1F2089|nr:YetF domain-containing protein [Cellulophaga sp. HaHaR_3_176]QWX83615.1 DUF421 domain-containing protein [Cellulophaga sp. HaHaR_3_176]
MNWLYSLTDPLLETIAGSILICIAIILLTRLVGLRTFAKFTAYDFAFTIAIGSIISSILTSSTSIVHGVVAIASLLLLAYVLSGLQKKFPKLSSLLSNQPLLLMKGSTILDKNLKHAQIEKSQVIAKLREANVLNFNQVFAVVLEATGDISVLHKTSDADNQKLNEQLLEGVRETP